MCVGVGVNVMVMVMVSGIVRVTLLVSAKAGVGSMSAGMVVVMIVRGERGSR
jgi:hypothetical protein